MSTEELAGIYLSVIVTILIFGIGFPSFIYERPTWLRRIRDRYSVWANLQKTLAFVLFSIAIIVIAYLFSDDIANHCVEVGRCHFYFNKLIVLPDIRFTIVVFVVLVVISAVSLALWTWFELSGGYARKAFWKHLFRRLFKSIMAFCIIFLIGVFWVNVGFWLVNLVRNENDIMSTIRSNDRDILNILVLIGLLASALLWYRLYLYRFDTILKRLMEVTECHHHLRRRLPPVSCYNYCLLQFRYALFDDNTTSEDRQSPEEKEHPLDRSIQHLGNMGANAEAIGDRLQVLESFAQLIKNEIPVATYDYILGAVKDTIGGGNQSRIDLFKKAVQLIASMADHISIEKESSSTVTLENIKSVQPSLLMRTHRKLKWKQETTKSSKLDIDTTDRVLGIALQDMGSEALSNIASWDAASLKATLIEAIGVMREGQQAEMLYAFGVSAQQGGHRDEALAFLNELEVRRPPEWRIYWPGLLARLAEDAEVGYRWAAQMARSRGFTDANLNTAQQNFIALDMNTAQAIARVRGFFTPEPARP